MTTSIMEYKQKYFEVDNEVEGELIILENRNNVVVDFLNNYPELWEIIYKFKEELEEYDRYYNFIKGMEWEINLLNTCNLDKLKRIWNYTFEKVNHWRTLGNNPWQVRLYIFYSILDERYPVNEYDKYGSLKNSFEKAFWKLNYSIPENYKYKLDQIFSNKTLRKSNIDLNNFKEFTNLIFNVCKRRSSGENTIYYPDYSDDENESYYRCLNDIDWYRFLSYTD